MMLEDLLIYESAEIWKGSSAGGGSAGLDEDGCGFFERMAADIAVVAAGAAADESSAVNALMLALMAPESVRERRWRQLHGEIARLAAGPHRSAGAHRDDEVRAALARLRAFVSENADLHTLQSA